jgi:hypothetical protein
VGEMEKQWQAKNCPNGFASAERSSLFRSYLLNTLAKSRTSTFLQGCSLVDGTRTFTMLSVCHRHRLIHSPKDGCDATTSTIIQGIHMSVFLLRLACE